MTVGTPDANGRAPSSTSSVKYRVLAGELTTPEDEADVEVIAQITDVREAGSLLDYLGQLELRARIAVTDRGSGAAADQSATVTPVTIPLTLDCTLTLGLAGSTCAAATTLDAVVPGIVREGTRAVWELDQIEVLDGGPDGDVNTADNDVFARQGIFIP